MRKQVRPFQVEVKKGQRRVDRPFLIEERPFLLEEDDPPDWLQKADAVLFRPAGVKDEAESAKPQGRILEAIAPPMQKDEAEPSAAEEPQPKRRGRKPGSKNRPKESLALPAAPRRRGRPPRHAASGVRALPVTGDLAQQALSRLAEAAGTTHDHRESDESPPLSPDVSTTAAAVAQDDGRPAAFDASIGRSAKTRGRIVAGTRWMRRLRSYAANAVARRQSRRPEPSSDAPR